MVSLKLRTKDIILQELRGVMSKSATLLDDPDYFYVIKRGIGILDEHLYSPREVIITSDFITQYKGGTFVDVTDLHIDEINNIYYSPTDFDFLLADAILGVGLMPYLSSTWGVSVIQNVSSYLVLQGNLNKINRQIADCDDYQLWPLNADGKQLLQIRSRPDLFWLEYLPHLDPELDSWYLFEHEYQFLFEYCRCEAYQRNAEAVFSASALGFGKEAKEQLDYWDKKKTDLLKEFSDKRIITYIG